MRLDVFLRNAAVAAGAFDPRIINAEALGKAPRDGTDARVTSISSEAFIVGQETAAIRWFARRFGFIGAVIFLVAMVGTFDTMRMWLRGLSHELAIRRAVGATKHRIAWWVLARAAGAGIAGTALGVFLYLSVMMPAVTNPLSAPPTTVQSVSRRAPRRMQIE